MYLYTPQKNPKKAAIVVSIVALVGILGGLFIHELFMIAALIFWVQYTAYLSFQQFKKKKKHKWSSFTEVLLHPQVRFFVFEFLCIIGLWSVIIYGQIYIGVAVLCVWLLFDLNFYFYYRRRS